MRAVRPSYDVGYVGSVVPGKGFGMVADIAEACPNHTFIVYGETASDPLIAEKLQKLRNVTIGGFVPKIRIAEAMASFQIGLAPYDRLGFGGSGRGFVTSDCMSSLKIVEYFSAGRVVVASRIPAVAAMVRDGETGILCDPDKLEEWREAIDKVVEEPRLAKRLAAGGRRVYENDYTHDTRASSFLSLINDLNASLYPSLSSQTSSG